ncbi:fasciclin domain-containing protein [Belliella sp. R4-6]|uniref:Fasciclin domain-containing protein n=1 Tax=Belliella alkalica TaxID=1730871 RepID=A0ABS9VFB5_9BACT|nr:fasciclin domain-containing protein [Belliella alkalica]MCH7414533.1 fasciclin domain-containing protein [Belliella alkalica]
MNRIFIYVIILICLGACSDPWDDRYQTGNESDKNLVQLLENDPELTGFAELLRTSGVAAEITGNKSYTIWAPTNTALQALPSSIRNNSEALKRFVGNHIGFLENFSIDASEPMRIKMINGKTNTFNGSIFQSAEASVSLTTKDILAKNGVLHKVNGILETKDNIWEIIQQESSNATNGYILDMVNINVITNVRTNYFQTEVVDLSNEDSLYTYIMLTDAAFESFKEELKVYYKDTLPEGEILKAYTLGVAKDLVLKGAHYDAPPSMLLSVDSVEVYLDQANVVEQINASNGVIYVMDKFDFKLSDKIPNIIIEGEDFDAVSGSRDRVSIRPRSWASGGRDVLVRGHGTASFHLTYRVPNANSVKYRVYWRAVNDDYIPRDNEQRIAINEITNPTFGYQWVVRNTFEEVFVGEYEVDLYGNLNLLLTSASVTNNDWNTMVLDYIRLEPVFE